MNKNTAILESILFACGEAVPVSRISTVMDITEDEVMESFNELSQIYQDNGHSLQFVKFGNKLQMCSCPEYSQFITKILETRKPMMLSNQALEALAIVAYYQPVTLAYINKVRGVDSSFSVGTLCDKGLIEQSGRLDVPGRPVLYSTSDLFLRTMGISSLSELPPLPEMEKTDAMEKLIAEIEQLSSVSSLPESEKPLPGQIEFDISDDNS